MRISVVCLGVVLALAACGPIDPPSNAPTLQPRSERHVRFYQGTQPRCGVRDLGHIEAGTFRELQSRAFRMHANAVILDPRTSRGTGGFSGMAVAFTRVDCQE
jgi:hypothetical protein